MMNLLNIAEASMPLRVLQQQPLSFMSMLVSAVSLLLAAQCCPACFTETALQLLLQPASGSPI
jgi:hypothetical protein